MKALNTDLFFLFSMSLIISVIGGFTLAGMISLSIEAGLFDLSLSTFELVSVSTGITFNCSVWLFSGIN